MICICKDPLALGVVHRSDAPCYIPEQRTWVGLTDEELAEFSDARLGSYDLCLAVEARLEEKNAPADRNV